MAAKLPRLLTSEVIGLDAKPADVSATKFDPMDIRSQVAELVDTDDPVRRFAIRDTGGKAGKTKGKRPSEFGFGSVPSTAVPRAAVLSGALKPRVLSLSGPRRLSLPNDEGVVDAARDQAGRASLAALALYGLIAQNESGYLLRSRCELIPRDSGRLELVGGTLQDVEAAQLNTDSARALLHAALAHAKVHGLTFRDHVLKLHADARLQELVRRSRQAAASGDAAGDE